LYFFIPKFWQTTLSTRFSSSEIDGCRSAIKEHLGTQEALDWGKGGEACGYLIGAKSSSSRQTLKEMHDVYHAL